MIYRLHALEGQRGDPRHRSCQTASVLLSRSGQRGQADVLRCSTAALPDPFVERKVPLVSSLDIQESKRIFMNHMTEVTITILDELKAFINEAVQAGPFSDAADFLVTLLYHAKGQCDAMLAEEQLTKIAALREEIGIGIDQADRNEVVEFNAEQIITEGHARHTARSAP